MSESTSKSSKILIIGKFPPPIGGVRIHVLRLIQQLEKRNFDQFIFFDLEKFSLLKLAGKLVSHRVIHLHTSNVWLRLFVAVYCMIFQKRLLITFHGNLGRNGFLKNFAEKLSVKTAGVPIVQNKESFHNAKSWNKNAVILSGFISPVITEPLRQDLEHNLALFICRHQNIFCTNAWNLTFDKTGKEIYGITEIIKAIQQTSSAGLIISDPSGRYKEFVKSQYPMPLPNIFWISEPHDFLNIIRLSQAYIRNTTTDGDSLSVHESLRLGIIVFASDCVTRPNGCLLYHDLAEINLEEKFQSAQLNFRKRPAAPDTVDALIRLYQCALAEIQ